MTSTPLLRSPARWSLKASPRSANDNDGCVLGMCCQFVVVSIFVGFIVSVCVWTLATVTRTEVQTICPGSLAWWYVVTSMVLSALILLPLVRDVWTTEIGDRRLPRLWFMVACLCVIECVWGYCELLLRGCDFALLPNEWLFGIGLGFATGYSCMLLYSLYRILMLWYLR